MTSGRSSNPKAASVRPNQMNNNENCETNGVEQVSGPADFDILGNDSEHLGGKWKLRRK